MKLDIEKMNTPEKEPRYTKTVFGHWFHEFDRDQFITYYLALKAGIINKDTPIEFAPKVSGEDLVDENTVVIEGVPEGVEGLNDKDTGNFDNDPTTDAPAAAMFYDQFRNELGDFAGVAIDINRWIRSAETGKKMKKGLKALSKGDLDLATTKIFYGLKLQHEHDPQGFLQSVVQLMDQLIDVERTNGLSDLYAEAIAEAQRAEARGFETLSQLISDPERFKVATTDTGVSLAYFDTRGSGASVGGTSVVMKAALKQGSTPHMVFLIDDARDDAGNVLGNRLLLKIPKSQTESEQVQKVDLRTLLSDRLHHLEALFGKGFVTEFGGHEGVIGSDREKGSGLEPKEIWSALQGFFDKPRYTQAEFEAKALDFANNKLGVETVLPRSTQTPGNAYELPERVMELGLPVDDNGERRVISISESDLPLYEEYFEEVLDGNVATFQSILKEKTTLSEPSLIADYRTLKAGGQLRELVQQPEQINKTLDALNDLNPSQIETLPPEVLSAILISVAGNETAIDLIWNKDNPRYKITSHHIPDWMRQDAEKYKAGRYTYLSLPYKIDEYLVKTVISQALKSGDLETIQQAGNTLITILGSESYKNSHQGPVYDQLLHSTFKLCTSDALLDLDQGPDTAVTLLNELATSYGAEMQHHWNLAKDQFKSLFTGARERIPELQTLYDRIGITVEQDANPDYQLELWSPTEITPPDPEIIQASIEKQKVSNREPIITVFVQVGRDIEELLKREGVFRIGEDKPEKELDFAGSVKINGYMRLGKDSSEADQLAGLLYKYVEDITHIATESGERAKIRIMTGGFPGVLSRKVTAIFTELTNKAIKERDLEKADKYISMSESLIFSDYNLQDKKFYDTKFVNSA